MKSHLFFLFLFVLVTIGCSRKTAPPPATHTTATTSKTSKSTTVRTAEKVKPLLDSAEAAEGTPTPTAPVAAPRAMIIVDARGNFAVSEKDLPGDAPKSILDNANARAYTPAQLKTLSYRFKQIPPRILYVPSALQKTNSRGTYYVFLKKYYYWQQPNGYFYLDEHYYQ